MVTPQKYQELLKEGIIIAEMFDDVLFSIDKRADYYRRKEQEYRDSDKWRQEMDPNYHDKYNNAKKAKNRKDHFRRQENIMLDLVEPIGICCSVNYKGMIIYEYDDEYRTMKNSPYVTERSKEDIFGEDITAERKHSPAFMRFYALKRMSWDGETTFVMRVQHIIVRVPFYEVCLYYENGNHSYRKPVRTGIESESELERALSETSKEYPGLAVSDKPEFSPKRLYVPSDELHDILPSQFTDKVVALIESGNYVFKREGSYDYLE